jgi:dihydrofolate synthase/folylpolyglutamate synthase
LQKDLSAWLAYLETLHPTFIDPGLERIGAVAKQLNFLPFACPVITVAGTNGKGSCVTLLESIFLAQGYKVGCYASPHLLVFNERVRINGQMIDDDALCQMFALIDKARGGIALSYFEFGTLAALLFFKQADVDVIILEVGLGGRLDATNIVDADVAIISTVDLDHMEWLGDDREKIGFEKAGVMRAGKACVSGDFAVPNSVRAHAKQIGAELYCQNEDFGYEKQKDSWSWWSKQQHLKNLPIPKIDLQNAATVLMALSILSHLPLAGDGVAKRRVRVDQNAIKQGLQNVFVPGRFQSFEYNHIKIILDVAHNPAAAKLLARQLAETSGAGKTLAVVAMLADKDMSNTVASLLEQVASWYLAKLEVPRGGSSQLLADSLHKLAAQNVHQYSTVIEAFDAAIAQARSGDRVVVFGSFYTVAEVLHNRASFL